MWDDGFQQQLVRYWDTEWSLKVLGSWYSQADDTGWIPRQLILGDEVRWSARSSSWSQVPGTANPPSHHWILESFLRDDSDNYGSNPLGEESSVFNEFLNQIWGSLERNLEWYLRTQTSDIPGFFRWAGRTEEYCLPSGMDDYPRAPLLTKKEAHLDLHSWMIVSTRVASKVAARLAKTEKARYFNHLNQKLTNSLLTNFWDDTRQLFDDFYCNQDNNLTFVGHMGYLNFFPVFLGVVPTDNPVFASIMDQLLDRENGLWTKFGLLSLSSKDIFFQQGDNYWTGALWLNINYLALSSFFKYVEERQVHPMAESLRTKIHLAYTELRQALIDLVVNSFMDTGYIWEVYNGTTGGGFDNHPFTGWSALIVNAMAELY
jgi:mannosyl-oligosaccharide glucosidase